MIGLRRTQPQPAADILQRTIEIFFPIEGGQIGCSPAPAPRLECGAGHWQLGSFEFHLGNADAHDEGDPVIIELRVSEGQHAQFTQCVPAVSGDDMKQVMRITKAPTIEGNIRVGEVFQTSGLAGLRQTFCRQALPVNKIEVGSAKRAGRTGRKAFAIAQGFKQVGMVGSDAPPIARIHEAIEIPIIGIARQRLDDTEHLRRILLVGNQLPHCPSALRGSTGRRNS